MGENRQKEKEEHKADLKGEARDPGRRNFLKALLLGGAVVAGSSAIALGPSGIGNAAKTVDNLLFPPKETIIGAGHKNYFVSDNANNLTGVKTRLVFKNDTWVPQQSNPVDRTELNPGPGFSYQVNAYPPTNLYSSSNPFNLEWTQYVIGVAVADLTGQGYPPTAFAYSELNTWSRDQIFNGDNSPPGLVSNIITVELPNPIKKGMAFDVDLVYDAYQNVSGWTTRIRDTDGSIFKGSEITVDLNGAATPTVVSEGPLSPQLIYPTPINVYTVDIVGNGNYRYSYFDKNDRMDLLFKTDAYSDFTRRLPSWAATVTFDSQGNEHGVITGEDANEYIYKASRPEYDGYDIQELLAGSLIDSQQLPQTSPSGFNPPTNSTSTNRGQMPHQTQMKALTDAVYRKLKTGRY